MADKTLPAKTVVVAAAPGAAPKKKKLSLDFDDTSAVLERKISP